MTAVPPKAKDLLSLLFCFVAHIACGSSCLILICEVVLCV